MGYRARDRQREPWGLWTTVGVVIAVVIGVAGLVVVAVGVLFTVSLSSYGSNK